MSHSFVTIYTTPFNNAKNTSDVVLQNYVFHDSKKSCQNETKDTSDSMFSMFSHGITAFHGLKVPLRQINQRNIVRVISWSFLFFSKTIRHAWSRCYCTSFCYTKRHETQRNDDFGGRNVTRFSANTERKGHGFLKTRRGGLYIF